MDNIEYLEENIDQVKVLIADTEKRIVAGEDCLDAQLGTLKRHLNDLCRQLAEATKPELVA